ncbi:PilZ domain-containing protein [Reinekea sp.]|jgi:c-di-GMP-binding flagellar brake protein YcgR|uniref:PilZ domain-containing protein n=1 Tax=Reinekea sp. TaxID=1970455 RepID=UPI002A81C8C5|nr:PilZ domain-containing protein [Reinekea sp.]
MSQTDQQYEEKRDFIRMTMNSTATLSIPDGTSFKVTCHDLSATGMSLIANHPVEIGSAVHIDIESTNDQFRSMTADGTVLRCEALDSGEYDLGLELKSIR